MSWGRININAHLENGGPACLLELCIISQLRHCQPEHASPMLMDPAQEAGSVHRTGCSASSRWFGDLSTDIDRAPSPPKVFFMLFELEGPRPRAAARIRGEVTDRVCNPTRHPCVSHSRAHVQTPAPLRGPNPRLTYCSHRRSCLRGC